MRLTVIDERAVTLDADVRDGSFLIAADDLIRATGWELKPEGLCREGVCVPVRDKITEGDRVDLARVADTLGRSLVAEAEAGVAALAGDPMASGQTASIDELELPGIDGRPVRMADTAGRKRLLIAWASW